MDTETMTHMVLPQPITWRAAVGHCRVACSCPPGFPSHSIDQYWPFIILMVSQDYYTCDILVFIENNWYISYFRKWLILTVAAICSRVLICHWGKSSCSVSCTNPSPITSLHLHHHPGLLWIKKLKMTKRRFELFRSLFLPLYHWLIGNLGFVDRIATIRLLSITP